MPVRTPSKLPGKKEQSSAANSNRHKIKNLRHKLMDKIFILLVTGMPILAITQTTAIHHPNKASCLV